MENPPFVKNQFWPGNNPEDMSDEIALANGRQLYDFYLPKYLNDEIKGLGENAHAKISYIPGFKPTDVVPPDLKVRILEYFNTDERKKWLGRQLYLLTAFNREKDFTNDIGDDTPMLLNWLFNRNGMTHPIPLVAPSPLSADLKMPDAAGGARRRRRTRAHKKRSRRSRKHRR